MKKQAKIVVLGSINVDISARTGVFPQDGETVSGESVRIGMGGKGTNQATSAARCGAEVVMIGRRGNDFFARIPEEHFRNESIRADYVKTDMEVGTGSALIEVLTTTGENRITVIPGANHRIEETDILAAEAEIASADVLLTQMETNADSIETFLKLGQKYGKPVVLNPAPALPIPEDWYPMIDTITPNETEACSYTGVTVGSESSAKDAADAFAKKGVKHVIITCGSKGVFCADYSGEKPFFCQVPTNRVKAVDTTGAGDAFNGAYCAAVGEGMTMLQACRFACCAATISVTRPGAADSMAKREEADAVYQSYYGSDKSITVPAMGLAKRLGVFWRALEGTGAGGIITEADVRRAAAKNTAE